MQIQLKQTEIITALKGYIASQGINLTGKSVDITFTASRGAAGIVADLEIEDAAQAPQVLTRSAPVEAAAPAAAVMAEAPAEEAEEAATAEAKPVAPVTSLFG